MDIKAVAVLIPFLLNFMLLFNRKKKWANSIYRWISVFAMLSAGLILLLLENKTKIEVPKMVVWGLMTPMIFSLIDMGFRNLSTAIHNRDLYLWLKGSSDIDDSILSGGSHVKTSDRIFSMIMLFSVLFLPFIGTLILKY